MKKITANIAAIVIFAPLVLLLSGCGNSEPASENNSTSEYNSSFYGYYGSYFGLGNMNDYDIDFYGLRPGDEFVKVKVTLGDISYDTHDMLYRFSNVSLKSLERLD